MLPLLNVDKFDNFRASRKTKATKGWHDGNIFLVVKILVLVAGKANNPVSDSGKALWSPSGNMFSRDADTLFRMFYANEENSLRPLQS